eukprot:7386895-Karenia_brevis.AAC.1
MDSYRLQSGHDNHQHTSMRRPRPHAAHRATSNRFSNSTEPEEVLKILPSLEPEGTIPEYAIQGDSV